MRTDSLSMSAVIPAKPHELYVAWLGSKGHSAMTGSPATASARVGGQFAAWEGYISGKNLELERDRRIVQTWRTTEFPDEAPDSRLEITLEAVGSGTKVTLTHTAIPAGQGPGYRKGWRDFYFTPMKSYFGNGA